MSVDHFLSTHPALVFVKVTDAKGSTPREAGAYMLVAPAAVYATIGGGHLEFLAIDKARAMLAAGEASATLDIPLGPEIGQCCGGRVVLALTSLDAQARADLLAREEAARELRPEIHLYGAGHVGLALAAALAAPSVQCHA
ncbi:XshC-Cox1-family protein, partial [Rhizobium sp. PDO1-076]|uniref:XdhC family protein n=1 Tax=Rhizobium sp. PDO1-076 TaxID=1125979 RepID=UPI00024E2987